MDFDKEILRGYIDTIILSQLIRRPMYGYELAKEVQLKSNGRFELKEGTMYLALKRLEKRSFIEAYWGDEDTSGGGRRKYYRVLAEGTRYFQAKRQEWDAMKSIMEAMFSETDDDSTHR